MSVTMHCTLKSKDGCFDEFLNTFKTRTLSHFFLLNRSGTEVSVPESVSSIANQRQISNWVEHKSLNAILALVSPLPRPLCRFCWREF